ncbi:hypothetical protein MKEN_01247000 [Mycena kentingensis (nom. inval.)]|nr:hypothetical protein MKEN_01247000 [Mycena kentingensis (nom. inval.)]
MYPASKSSRSQSSAAATLPNAPRRPHQTARKSTGGQPPKKRARSASSSDGDETVVSSRQRAAGRSTHSRASTSRSVPNSSMSAAGPTNFRESTAGPSVSAASSRPSTSRSAEPATTGPASRCDLCGGAQAPPSVDGVSDFITKCHHPFHLGCFLNWLRVAAVPSRDRCPTCFKSLRIDGLYWVEVQSPGGLCATDLTPQITTYISNLKRVKQQILFDMLAARNLRMAEGLFNSGDPPDVDFLNPDGFSALHLRAMDNDVVGIEFLLHLGADWNLPSAVGFTAVQYARQANALEAVARLEQRN